MAVPTEVRVQIARMSRCLKLAFKIMFDIFRELLVISYILGCQKRFQFNLLVFNVVPVFFLGADLGARCARRG